jgi:hypothetical protein
MSSTDATCERILLCGGMRVDQQSHHAPPEQGTEHLDALSLVSC